MGRKSRKLFVVAIVVVAPNLALVVILTLAARRFPPKQSRALHEHFHEGEKRMNDVSRLVVEHALWTRNIFLSTMSE